MHIQSDQLFSHFFCLCDSLQVITRTSEGKSAVHFDLEELGTFMAEFYDDLNVLCDRLKISEDTLKARSLAIAEYFARNHTP